ncbi:hypothetical protein [Secundilactobacillus paracollinoides]|uniref:hypothetical protein n=1 Tax=Secundilactobacillus paracollinoides TaxID=240427 RepID=UPI000A778D25
MGLITKTDVVYDPEHELKTDLYYDDSKPARATIIDIHGGGWFRGDKGKDADWLNDWLLAAMRQWCRIIGLHLKLITRHP